MQLKMWILSGTAIALWLAPLTALDKKVGWHKSIQGLSLSAAIACAVSAGNIARELSEQGEIEAIKTRAITADVVDEIATNAYVSQAQRQQEAEQILASGDQSDDRIDESEAELNSIKESLELLLQKTSSDSGELVLKTLTTRQQEQIESILQCHAKGIHGKNKILKEVWGVSAGSSRAYQDAKAEYEYLLPFVKGDSDERP
jgi:DNA anti-recombination protein RmuC